MELSILTNSVRQKYLNILLKGVAGDNIGKEIHENV